MGHRSFECLEKDDIGQRGAYIAQGVQQQKKVLVAENMLQIGEVLMLNKVLLNPEKKVVEPTQRKALFRTMCKAKGI